MWICGHTCLTRQQLFYFVRFIFVRVYDCSLVLCEIQFAGHNVAFCVITGVQVMLHTQHAGIFVINLRAVFNCLTSTVHQLSPADRMLRNFSHGGDVGISQSTKILP